MGSRDRVCAVVVTFNRKQLLSECLNSLMSQEKSLNAIFIIDNASTDGTPQMLMEEEYIHQLPPSNLNKLWETSLSLTEVSIYYVRMHENTGGAGGFYEGMVRAYKKGYEWLWLMDDDTNPEKQSLRVLSDYMNFENVSALCTLVKDTGGNIEETSRGMFNFNGIPMQKFISRDVIQKKCLEIDMCSFVGILISKRAIEKIGFPKKEFFIHADDLEYSIRLREVGRILMITGSVVIHKYNRNVHLEEKTKFSKKSMRIPYPNLWLYYYSYRNLTWIGKKYSDSKIKLYYDVIAWFLITSVDILIFDDHKIKRIKFLKEAFLDGLNGKFDNYKPKKILYNK